MSKDIKIVDYIPKNRSLCESCEFFSECPYDYICPSCNRLIEFENERGEL